MAGVEMRERRNVMVDPEKLARAAEALGTAGATATIDAALACAIEQAAFSRLASTGYDFSALADELDALRRPRPSVEPPTR